MFNIKNLLDLFGKKQQNKNLSDHQNMIQNHKKPNIAWTALNSKINQNILMIVYITTIPHIFYIKPALKIFISIFIVLFQIILLKTSSFFILQRKWLQYGFFIASIILIFTQYGTFLGIEAASSLLVVVFLTKFFELKNYRDAIVFSNLALFVLASLFLYSQAVLLALIVFIGIVFCLYNLYQLQNYNDAFEEVSVQSLSQLSLFKQSFIGVLKLTCLALPFMVVLFIFMPRFPPLWQLPSLNQQAKTGVSDRMSPGDFSNLSQSSELAFRVIFDDMRQMPSRQNLYWRAMVLENFDGQTWTKNNASADHQVMMRQYQRPVRYEVSHKQYRLNDIPAWYALPQVSSEQMLVPTLGYVLIVEPTQQNWIYALDYSLASAPLLLKSDFSVQSPIEITQRQRFRLALINHLVYTDVQANDVALDQDLILPKTLNPRSQALAQQLFIQSKQNPEAYIQNVLNYIRTQGYRYTLSPPLLQSKNRIDEFLFESKEGFCEHYSSAFVNLMRMQGIPARVVVGYQGGKLAPDAQSWEVRQLDAHAWAEVWIKGKGWQRVDPTAAIAPDRITQGMQEFSQNSSALYGDSQFSKIKATQIKWITQLKVWTDYANYQWQDKVIGFDRDKQYNWFKKWSIQNVLVRIIVFVLVLILCIVALFYWLSYQQKSKYSRLEKSLMQLSKRLQKYHLARAKGEPVLTWFNRIEPSIQDKEAITALIQLYTQHTYIRPLSHQQQLRLLRLIKSLEIQS